MATATTGKNGNRWWLQTILIVLPIVGVGLGVWHQMDMRLALNEDRLASHCEQAATLTTDGCTPARENTVEIKLLRQDFLHLAEKMDASIAVQQRLVDEVYNR